MKFSHKVLCVTCLLLPTITLAYNGANDTAIRNSDITTTQVSMNQTTGVMQNHFLRLRCRQVLLMLVKSIQPSLKWMFVG